jgi:hypothetical protein
MSVPPPATSSTSWTRCAGALAAPSPRSCRNPRRSRARRRAAEGNADVDRGQEAGKGSGCEEDGLEAAAQVGLATPQDRAATLIKGSEIATTGSPLVWRVGYPQDDFVAQQIAPLRSVADGAQDGSVGHPEVVSPYEGMNVEARDPILERGYCVAGYSDPERRTENLHGLFRVPEWSPPRSECTLPPRQHCRARRPRRTLLARNPGRGGQGRVHGLFHAGSGVCLAKTDESRWPERQGQYLQMSSYKEYRNMFAITAWRGCGDKKRPGARR